ncbi:MAG: hypothetical protein FJX75_05700 [Armatimonadetes bacterium]|nr:hypothetical protein [Armatimonadota bacterium]
MFVASLAICSVAAADPSALKAIQAAMPASPPLRPAFAAARPGAMTVVDAQGLDYDRNLTLLALQGLVNRRAPRLLVVGMSEFNRDADRFWVERLKTLYGVQAEETDFEGALRRYGPELKGLIAYPVDNSQSENVACMVAALLKVLPMAPGVREEAERATGLAVTYDLSGCFANRLEAIRWSRERLGSALQPLDLACLDDRTWLLIRDYAVMRGAFIAGLSTADSTEAALRGEISGLLPPNAIQWGWVCRDGEGEHVAFGSQHGLRTLCSTNSPNLSFLSQIRPLTKMLPKRTIAKAIKPERKAYLSFVLSDGDSIPILLTRQWYRWDEKARGQVPFGWEMQPLLDRIAPAVQEYYFETATDNDEFILGPSGAGYCHPSSLPDPSVLFRETQQGLRELSASVVGVIDSKLDAESAAFLSKGVPNAAGFFHGWGGTPTARPLFGAGKPHMQYRVCPPSPEGPKDAAYYAKVADEIRRIATMDGLPCCIPVHLSCYWAGPDDVPKIMAALGKDLPAEVVLPSQLVRLAAEAYPNRVFLTVPEEVQGIAGLSYTLPVTLDSTHAKATEVQVIVAPAAALDGLTTLRMTLPPTGTQTETMRLRLPEASRETDLRVTLLAGREVLASRLVRLRPAPPPLDTPEGYDALQSIWEAESVAHGNGHEFADREAHNGKAWAAIEGRDTNEGTTIWGQYERLEPGAYAVAFRCRTTSKDDQPIARLDCFDFERTKQGRDGTLAQRVLTPSDLPADSAYQDVWLTFELTEPAKLEYRVAWTGTGDIVTDRVVVLRRQTQG